MSSARDAGSTLLRALGTVVYTVFAVASYALAATIAGLAIGLGMLLVFPDPCLPFCVAAESEGGGAEEAASVVVLVGAVVAGLGVVYLMRRQWRTWLALALPWLALLAIVPVTLGALVAVDAGTSNRVVVSCSC